MELKLNQVIDQVCKDKGISKEIIIETLESAMLTAAKKKFGLEKDIEAHYNPKACEVELFEFKVVVDKVSKPDLEIDLKAAKKHDPESQVGDVLGLKMDSNEFGRIAAHTAKQVIVQKVRDAERDIIFSEFKDRKSEIVSGIVRRFDKKDVIVDIGKTEAVLPEKEQISKDRYRSGDRIQAYILEVLPNSRGPQIILSRTNPGFLIKLFDAEVPEISEGIVKVVNAAREPGERAKISVYSEDMDVDPVGACVGVKGSRVQAIVQELKGEKIDIVHFSPDPAKYICNAIAPADVQKVIIDDKKHSVELIVADEYLSLAIGKRGQNVRLASQLTQWGIDIICESKMKAMGEKTKTIFLKTELIDEATVNLIIKHGFVKIDDFIDTDSAELKDMLALSIDKIEELKRQIKAIYEAQNVDE